MSDLQQEIKHYSFELNREMLKLLGDEFDLDKTTSRFAEAVKGKSLSEIETVGKDFFETFGREWMTRTHKLGDEYPDRTYEVLREAVDKTNGYLKFALVPQRFIEIAYLSTQDLSVLPIIENNHNRLIYRLIQCKCLNLVREKCGEEIANLLTCRHGCLEACRTIHRELEIDALIRQTATIPVGGYCQFEAARA
ncbi:MAG: hypothetical protein AB1585_04190 [Thermodesulfobacteriota bacterium]